MLNICGAPQLYKCNFATKIKHNLKKGKLKKVGCQAKQTR